MNQYTHKVSPRGSRPIEVVVLAHTYAESREVARSIVRDVWGPTFEKNPDHEIVGEIVKVEQVDSGITLPPGSLAGSLF